VKNHPSNTPEPDLTFYAYACAECGNTTWLADAPEKFIYCALCSRDDLQVTEVLKVWGKYKTETVEDG
jgi:ribosomal protein S27E